VLVLQGMPDVTLRSMGFDDQASTLNVTEPESVADMHALYRAAGADCAITNTAGATSDRLAELGLVGATADINAAGVQLARSANYPHVLARVTPCKTQTSSDADPGQAAERDAIAAEQYAEQAAALASKAPDAILLSGFSTAQDAMPAIAAAKSVIELPVFVTLHPAETSSEGNGTAAAANKSGWAGEAARKLAAAGVDGIGCEGMKLEQMIPALTEMRQACNLPLIGIPDLPQEDFGTGNRARDAQADAAFSAAMALVEAGACMVGMREGSSAACCGAMYASVGGTDIQEGTAAE
jgi:5-methyltetrahydrofolate--homocysteine methyltransferase